jgi:alpha-ketoglutarate-dependent taurine dioxygenase
LQLHVHPISNSGREHGGKDDEISVISSVQQKKLYKSPLFNSSGKRQSLRESWHSDITFENVPSDYAILRLTELPKTGGGKYIRHIFADST